MKVNYVKIFTLKIGDFAYLIKPEQKKFVILIVQIVQILPLIVKIQPCCFYYFDTNTSQTEQRKILIFNGYEEESYLFANRTYALRKLNKLNQKINNNTY